MSIKALEANRAIPFAEKSAKLQTRQSDAVRSQAPCCKFCGSPEHLVEVCEEVNRYILTGMCKRSVFGKVVLPSGAELPRRIKGKGLRERFEEYHRQYPGQKAAQAYLEDLVSPRRPVSPDAKEATSPATEATITATCEAPGQPHHPECTPRDPRAASDHTRAIGQSGDPRKATVRFCEALAVPRITARPISGRSGPENNEAASGVPTRMRETNFAPHLKANTPEMRKRIARNLSDAPMTISQRELLSLAPSVRAQVASTAARFPAPPEEQAMYLVQEAEPRLTRDPSLGEAKLLKRSQVLPPAAKARGPAAPSEIGQKVPWSPREDPIAQPPRFSRAESCIVPVSVPDTSSDPSSVSDTASVPPASVPINIGNMSNVPLSTYIIHNPTCVATPSVSNPLCAPLSAHDYRSVSSRVHSSVSDTSSVSLTSVSDSPSLHDSISVIPSVPNSHSVSLCVRDSIHVPFSVSVSVPEFPSVRFSVPEHPQLALRTPHTPYAIRSRPRWPRIQVSHLVSARVRQRARRPPPASFRAPFPHFFYCVSRRDELCGVGPSGNRPPTHRRATALRLLFYPRKPPDAHRCRCRTPAQS